MRAICKFVTIILAFSGMVTITSQLPIVLNFLFSTLLGFLIAGGVFNS